MRRPPFRLLESAFPARMCMSSASSMRSAAKAQALGGRSKNPRQKSLISPNLGLGSWRVRQVLRLKHFNLASNLRLWHTNRFPGTSLNSGGILYENVSVRTELVPFPFFFRVAGMPGRDPKRLHGRAAREELHKIHSTSQRAPQPRRRFRRRESEDGERLRRIFRTIGMWAHGCATPQPQNGLLATGHQNKTKLHHHARRSLHSGNALELLGGAVLDLRARRDRERRSAGVA